MPLGVGACFVVGRNMKFEHAIVCQHTSPVLSFWPLTPPQVKESLDRLEVLEAELKESEDGKKTAISRRDYNTAGKLNEEVARLKVSVSRKFSGDRKHAETWPESFSAQSQHRNGNTRVVAQASQGCR